MYLFHLTEFVRTDCRFSEKSVGSIGVWFRLWVGKGIQCACFSVMQSTTTYEQDATDGSAPAPLVFLSPRLFPILDPLIYPSPIPGCSSGTFLWVFPPLHSHCCCCSCFNQPFCFLPPLFCVYLSQHHYHHAFPLLRKIYRLLIALCAKSGLILLYTPTYFHSPQASSSISSSGSLPWPSHHTFTQAFSPSLHNFFPPLLVQSYLYLKI